MEKIDFVITWVDGTDEEWLKEKNKYSPNKIDDVGNNRYRDMGTLKYWFRAVEKYAPWVNKIHFVTYGHLPEWLNTSHPKLNIVNHKDYIPEQYLPTFSSHPIELNLHRIKGLSDKFVYFNDDTFLNDYIDERFFFKKGLPCDYLWVENINFIKIDDVFGHVVANCARETSKICSYIKSFFLNFTKYVNFKYPVKCILRNVVLIANKDFFPGFSGNHLAQPYLKSSFMEPWDKDYESFDKISHNKFRTPIDISPYVFRYYQLVTGKFHPVKKASRGAVYTIGVNTKKMLSDIVEGNSKMICINDGLDNVDLNDFIPSVIDAFECKLSKKSEFEL